MLQEKKKKKKKLERKFNTTFESVEKDEGKKKLLPYIFRFIYLFTALISFFFLHFPYPSFDKRVRIYVEKIERKSYRWN